MWCHTGFRRKLHFAAAKLQCMRRNTTLQENKGLLFYSLNRHPAEMKSSPARAVLLEEVGPSTYSRNFQPWARCPETLPGADESGYLLAATCISDTKTHYTGCSLTPWSWELGGVSCASSVSR